MHLGRQYLRQNQVTPINSGCIPTYIFIQTNFKELSLFTVSLLRQLTGGNGPTLHAHIYNFFPFYNQLPNRYLSEAQRQTRIVYNAFREVASKTDLIRPGDLIAHLRQQDQPLGIWYVNGEFLRLAALGLIKLDPASAKWRLEPDGDFDEAVARVNGAWDEIG